MQKIGCSSNTSEFFLWKRRSLEAKVYIDYCKNTSKRNKSADLRVILIISQDFYPKSWLKRPRLPELQYTYRRSPLTSGVCPLEALPQRQTTSSDLWSRSQRRHRPRQLHTCLQKISQMWGLSKVNSNQFNIFIFISLLTVDYMSHIT